MNAQRVLKRTIRGALLLGVVAATPGLADDQSNTTLVISPGKCVALKRDNICYLDVDVQWQTPTSGNYCLHRAGEPQPLRCWQASQSGRYTFEFAQRNSTRFELRQQGQNNALANARIDVRWVYNKRRDRSFGWRVF